jgi:4'-phosphopantetheinyl transferase
MATLKPRLLNTSELQAGADSCAGLDGLFGDPVVWMGQRADVSETSLELDAVLTDDEKIRRDRFRRRPDQQRFAAGRAWLRVLLGKYLGLPPRQVDLRLGDHGKPYVKHGRRTLAVHFNVAHSGDLILLVFHARWEIGVDVEQITSDQNWDGVARQLYSAAQYTAWAALEANTRLQSFYEEWTRREAGLKALGSGFAVEQPLGWESQLNFFELELPSGYAGSVAVLEREKLC